MNLKNHTGDCTIYASLVNDTPEAGICTCGYGLDYLRKKGDYSELYSNELIEKLESERKPISKKDLDNLLDFLGESYSKE